jgi:hypothetical protein
MRTIEDVYQKIIELHDLQVHVILKNSLYLKGVSPEFTLMPTKEIFPVKDIMVFFYADESFDTMYERAERFLFQRQEFLDNMATADFKALLDDKALQKYRQNILCNKK